MAKTSKQPFAEDEQLSHDVLASIGFVTTQWAHLEEQAGVFAAFLLDADFHIFRSVTANLNALGKFDSLSAVTKIVLSKGQAKGICVLCDRAKAKNAERNRIVHGLWYPVEDKKTKIAKENVAERISYRAYGELDRQTEQVAAKRMIGFGQEVAAIRQELQQRLKRFGFYDGSGTLRDSLHRKQRKRLYPKQKAPNPRRNRRGRRNGGKALLLPPPASSV